MMIDGNPVQTPSAQPGLLDDLSLELLGPVPPSEWIGSWPWIVSGVIVALVIAAIALWIVRRKPTVAAIPPATLAHSRLSRLQTTSNGQSGANYSHAIASILRDYLSDSQIAPAVNMTASELDAELDKRSIASGIKEQIINLLNECDECRFANADINDEVRSNLAAATAAIIETIEASRQPES